MERNGEIGTIQVVGASNFVKCQCKITLENQSKYKNKKLCRLFMYRKRV
jgi:hypothetical protein